MLITINEIDNAFIVEVVKDKGNYYKKYSQPKDALAVSDFVYEVMIEELTRQEQSREETTEEVQATKEIRP